MAYTDGRYVTPPTGVIPPSENDGLHPPYPSGMARKMPAMPTDAVDPNRARYDRVVARGQTALAARLKQKYGY